MEFKPGDIVVWIGIRPCIARISYYVACGNYYLTKGYNSCHESNLRLANEIEIHLLGDREIVILIESNCMCPEPFELKPKTRFHSHCTGELLSNELLIAQLKQSEQREDFEDCILLRDELERRGFNRLQILNSD